MSSLKIYEIEIAEATSHKNPLTAVVGLDIIANAIRGALWQPWAKEEALSLAIKADVAADEIAKKNGIRRETALLDWIDSKAPKKNEE